MDVAGKSTSLRAPDTRLIPSIVAPTELSGRRDNPKVPQALPGVAEPRMALSASRAPNSGCLDQARVTEAATWIRAKVAATLRKGAEDVGEYILRTFFGGDPHLARLRSPNKDASYRALAAKCGTPELPVSKTWLNNAVGIALIARALPANASAFRTLPPSYQEALLPVRDPVTVERLAREAVACAATCRELRQIAAKNLPCATRRRQSHTPRAPLAMQNIRELAACFAASAGKVSLSQNAVDRMPAAHKKESLRLLDSMIQRLGRLKDAVSRG
jgi:hypothetical protein